MKESPSGGSANPQFAKQASEVCPRPRSRPRPLKSACRSCTGAFQKLPRSLEPTAPLWKPSPLLQSQQVESFRQRFDWIFIIMYSVLNFTAKCLWSKFQVYSETQMNRTLLKPKIPARYKQWFFFFFFLHSIQGLQPLKCALFFNGPLEAPSLWRTHPRSA